MSLKDSQHLLASLQSAIPGLPPAEQKVAAYVMEHASEVVYLSVTQLADAAGVAEATVTRFCRSIGLRGYQELKIRLSRDLAWHAGATSQVVAEPGVAESSTVAGLAQRLTQLSAQSLEATLQMIDLQAVEAAAEAIVNARHIRFYGMGESWPLCYWAQVRLLALGRPADAYMDAHIQAMSAALLGPGDVAFGISHMGETKDVVESLRTAREGGATTICLTAQGRAPVTEVSDIRLICVTQDLALARRTVRSKISQVLLLDLLITLVALKLQTAQESADRATEAVLDKLY